MKMEEVGKNNPVVKIFMIPQQFPCGPQSSCCGPIGLSDDEVNWLTNTIKKRYNVDIEVLNLLDKEVQKNNREVVSLVRALGWGCLPIISVDEKIVAVGMPTSEDNLLESLNALPINDLNN